MRITEQINGHLMRQIMSRERVEEAGILRQFNNALIHKLFEREKTEIVRSTLTRHKPLNTIVVKHVLGILKIEGAISTKNYLLLRHFGIDEYKSILGDLNTADILPNWNDKPRRQTMHRRQNEAI